jgi:hypothetical protein
VSDDMRDLSYRREIVSPDGRWSAVTREVLPLTPTMTVLLERQAASSQSLNKGCVFMVSAVAAVLVVLTLTHDISWDPVVVAVCCFFGIPAILELTKGSDESIMADIEDGTYIRLAGPIHLCTVWYEEDGSVDYSVQIDSEDFPIPLLTFQSLQQVTWAIVDYAPCSHTVFALREASGRVLWQHPDYLPDATSTPAAD